MTVIKHLSSVIQECCFKAFPCPKERESEREKKKKLFRQLVWCLVIMLMGL